MTLKEKVEHLQNASIAFIANNPGSTEVWWTIEDWNIDEMREYAQWTGQKLQFSENRRRMYVRGSTGLGTVVFIYSKKVEVKEHIVITEAIVNA